MSGHKRNVSLRPHNLWGTLDQNGATAESSGIMDNVKLAVNTVSEKVTGKKAMSTDSKPAAPKTNGVSGGLPDFIKERNALFNELKQKYDQELAAKERTPIKIRFTPEPGKTVEIDGNAWDTTPGKLLRDVPKDRAAKIVVARVDGKEWDLDRPLEQNCSVGYFTFDDKEGRNVFWHSSAHVLGECAEHEYSCRLSHGPPTDMGFFYDMALEPGRAVIEQEWPSLESRAKKFIKEKQQFERLEVSKDDLLKMFGYSKYKTHYINQLVKGDRSTVYRNGDLVDLCQGPHIQNTKKIEAFKIMKNSSAYFLGDQANDSLQRIHAVSFPTKQGLKDWETMLEEAKKRNHQLIGKQQKLFFFSQESPGSAFLLPHGTRIFNALQNMLREQYWDRGYQEVQSPNMYNVNLWKTSGHWQHYQDDMFQIRLTEDTSEPMPLTDQKPDGQPLQSKNEDKDKGLFGLKPMNCPGHCLLFRDEERSYRDLPWRIADFGVLHRNEASGALSGLTRVRKFQQDDTHIFCTKDQVTEEIKDLFDFMKSVYGLFGFPFKLKLSTRPEGYMGTIAEWDDAEKQLKTALTDFCGDDWELNPGDGAFYGPKIDITISDALGREFQCATIQLDFQGPQNFRLEYRTGESAEKSTVATDEPLKTDSRGRDVKALAPGMARPVMIHRAIIGSFERFMAILTEHFAGKWPFWLSPRQIMIIPVHPSAKDYVLELQKVFHKERMYVDIDLSGNTLPKKIRQAQIEQYNFTFVVGEEERNTRSVNVRNRDDPSTQKQGQLVPLDVAVKKLKELRDERKMVNRLEIDA